MVLKRQGPRRPARSRSEVADLSALLQCGCTRRTVRSDSKCFLAKARPDPALRRPSSTISTLLEERDRHENLSAGDRGRFVRAVPCYASAGVHQRPRRRRRSIAWGPTQRIVSSHDHRIPRNSLKRVVSWKLAPALNDRGIPDHANCEDGYRSWSVSSTAIFWVDIVDLALAGQGCFGLFTASRWPAVLGTATTASERGDIMATAKATPP